MGRAKRLIIPLFIPFAGCPELCVYCDQRALAGEGGLDEPAIRSTVEAHLATWKGRGGPVEIAFYGGTFTALPAERQRFLLDAVSGYIADGAVSSIRVSTRPDAVTAEGAALLAGRSVRTVELGVQSMSDEVLRLSGRGHGAEATRTATALLKKAGFAVGHQLMPGLPGDTFDTALKSAEESASLKPDFVRIYPALVLKGTRLHGMYMEGKYTPWPLEEMAALSAAIKGVFDAASIPIARMGLQHTAELAGSLVAGPHHPAFRSIVEGLAAKRRAAAPDGPIRGICR